MKILLVAATNQEIKKDLFSRKDILITGVGMLNTTLNLTAKLSSTNYDLVINMGVAGSFNSDIKIGKVVEVVEDIFSEIGFQNGESFYEFINFEVKNTFVVDGRTNLKKVKGITVNTVHGNEDSIHKIIDRLNPDIESMEGAACFMVCNNFSIPCIQIRAISNKVEKRNTQNWNLPLAIENLNSEVKQIISEL